MHRLIILLPLLAVAFIGYSQSIPATRADFQAAARFSPKKLEKIIFTTQVDAHWLKKSTRFWYMYETTEGRKWYIVDPLKSEKKTLFDNDRLAAAISRIVKDPFEAKHLGLDSLRFIKDENWIQFEVKSSESLRKKDSSKDSTAKKIYYFEYNLLDG